MALAGILIPLRPGLADAPHVLVRRARAHECPTLETIQWQIDGFFSQLPYKCYLGRGSICENRPKICPWVVSRAASILTLSWLWQAFSFLSVLGSLTLMTCWSGALGHMNPLPVVGHATPSVEADNAPAWFVLTLFWYPPPSWECLLLVWCWPATRPGFRVYG